MAIRASFLLCAVAIVALVQGSPLMPARPVPYKDVKMLWWPTEDGGVIPALMEGGPKLLASDEEHVHFMLFTLQNQNTAQEISIGDRSALIAAGYVAGAKLILLTHGFGSNASRGPTPTWKAALFEGNHNVNIISIDWAELAKSPNYNRAAAATEIVGEKTARLVEWLVSEGLVTMEDVHFAGHSLGAHAGGYMGRFLGAGRVGRITGLDPALPLFGSKGDEDRIDPTDAAFVDVIHTAGGGLAFVKACGHVDFYPNGGSRQVGCGADVVSACAHRRCYQYAAESILNPNAFFSCKCDEWEDFNEGDCACTESTNMGFHVPTHLRGKFYLKTKGESPYSLS